MFKDYEIFGSSQGEGQTTTPSPTRTGPAGSNNGTPSPTTAAPTTAAPKTCTCAHGEAADDAECKAHGGDRCTKCNEGFTLDRTDEICRCDIPMPIFGEDKCPDGKVCRLKNTDTDGGTHEVCKTLVKSGGDCSSPDTQACDDHLYCDEKTNKCVDYYWMSPIGYPLWWVIYVLLVLVAIFIVWFLRRKKMSAKPPIISG